MLHPTLTPLVNPSANISCDLEDFRPEGTIEEAREAFHAEVAKLDAMADKALPDVDIAETEIPVSGGTISCRIYRPHALKSDEAAPAVLYLHGGGWIFGNLETHDGICRMLAYHAPCVVVSVAYRLAPEVRFPVPLEDSLAAYCWLRDNASALGIADSRIGVAGDSAGANLAFGVSRLAARTGIEPPRFQLLLYPVCDLVAVTASRKRYARGYWLDSLDFQISCYIGSEADRNDPRASPRLVRDLHVMPPTRIVTAGYDPLCDEGIALAEQLQNAGVVAEHVHFPQYIHGFASLRGLLPEVDDVLREQAAALSRWLARECFG